MIFASYISYKDEMNFLLQTDRLILRELDETYFEEQNKEFNEEITKFQWPDPFVDMNVAKEILNGFIVEMNEGKMFELVILNKNNEFIGSLEIFNIDGKTPELGIWLKKDCHGFGYGYEAIKAIVEYLNNQNKYNYYIYNVDVRNVGSIKLVEKFNFKKAGYEELETPSMKNYICRPIIFLIEINNFFKLILDRSSDPTEQI